MDSYDDPTILLQPVSQIQPRALEWLWLNRLALGKLAILDADPGIGKSLLGLDLAARLSTGRPLPDDTPGPGPASSIILNGEDNENDTIRPRLQAMGADMERVFVLHRKSTSFPEPLRFPAHAHYLDWALKKTAARLVVIDPITAFFGPEVNINSDSSVRRALSPLARLAEEYRCSILFKRHLNKMAGFQSLYRGSGSIGLVGVCRSAWLLARHPDNPLHCVMAQVKNNLAAPQPSLAFKIEDPATATPTLTWLGPCSWVADQLLAAACRRPPGPSPRDRAAVFLSSLLEKAPHTSREIWTLARHRFSKRTLHRAKLELKIRSVRIYTDGQRLSYWLLPGQQLPNTIPPESIPPDLEPWLAPLREKYPPSTPLDDL